MASDGDGDGGDPLPSPALPPVPGPTEDDEVVGEVPQGTEGEASLESVDRTEGVDMVEPGNDVGVETPVHNSELEACLNAGDWDKALECLAAMVENGQAENVISGPQSRDIYRAHPEVVLVLRRQRYLDLRRTGNIAAARVYFRDLIQARYPQGTQNSFVNSTILEALRRWSRSVSVPQGDVLQEVAATRQSVRDYLLLYFPAYRPDVQASGRSKIWELGEKLNRGGRCLACHRLFRDFSVTKLRQHLEGRGEGHTAKCLAATDYVRDRLAQILDEERSSRDAAPMPTPTHAPHDRGDDTDDDGAAPAPQAA